MRKPVTQSEWADECRRGFRGHSRFKSINAIVKDYIGRFRPTAARELQDFANMRTFDEMITRAGLARMPHGKRYSHQRRIPAAVLARATRRLHAARLESARSFDDLFQRLNGAVSPIRGIGELYVYDTTLRIGAYLGLLPSKVCLHAGARTGARFLGLDYRAESVSISQLPIKLRRLKPHEIEDVLCIYKEWLATAKSV